MTPRDTTSSQPPLADDIPEDERWRLVNESGLLSKIKSDGQSAQSPARSLSDEVFRAVTLLIPFSTLYLVMDILCLQQYQQKPTLRGELGRLTEAIPILAIFIFYTNRHKSRRFVQAGLAIAAALSSMRLFWIVNHGSWTVVIRQAPPLSTIWIYCIVQLNLLPAVLALIVTAIYVKVSGLRVAF